jgi:hypothetical protein
MQTVNSLSHAARAAAYEKLIEGARLHPQQTLRGICAAKQVFLQLPSEVSQEIEQTLVAILGDKAISALH